MTAVLLIGLVILVSSCGAEDLVDLRVGDQVFRVEVADTPEEWRRGLMNRTEMDEDAGMLFVFERERTLSFWMKDTLIPLSVAYISSGGIILEIHDLTPGDLTPVESRQPALYALEVNQGAFDRFGVRVGDRMDYRR